MMSAPATGASRARFWRRNAPTALADAPKPMNTTENPKTKESEEAKRPDFGRFSLAQLLDANAGEHGDVAGHQGKDARREKGDEPGEKASRSETSVIRDQSLRV